MNEKIEIEKGKLSLSFSSLFCCVVEIQSFIYCVCIIGWPKLRQEINLNPGNIITCFKQKLINVSLTSVFGHFNIQTQYDCCNNARVKKNPFD